MSIVYKMQRSFPIRYIFDIGTWRVLRKNSCQLRKSLGYGYKVLYQKNMTCLLALLCDQYGSDKGEIRQSDHPYFWKSHNYTDYYTRLFDSIRMDVRSVFECGIGTNNTKVPSNMGKNGVPGASLRVWRDYFPNAQIIGADIDTDILFSEERIKTYHVDQMDAASIKKLWESVTIQQFDFMIDDGYHSFKAGTCLFEHSVAKLSAKGVYIIEDVVLHELPLYQHYFSDKPYCVDYVLLDNNAGQMRDNNLVVIRRR